MSQDQWLEKIDAYAASKLDALETRNVHARTVNRETLTVVVAQNTGTAFGKAHDFSTVLKSIDPVGAFRSRLPLSHYSDYELYIDRIAQGETDVLCTDVVEYFAGTSGTAGKIKLIPKTAAARKLSAEYMGIISRAVVKRQIPGVDMRTRGVNIMSMNRPEHRWHGQLPIGASTNAGMAGFQDYIPLFWTSPAPVFSMADNASASYLHALFGLADKRVAYLESIFSTQMTSWFDTILSRATELVEDIAAGTISQSIRLTDEQRASLEVRLEPNPVRAQEILHAIDEGTSGLALRIWPNLKYLSTVTTGSFAIGLGWLKHITHSNFPILSKAYTASESMIGVQVTPGSDEYVLATGAAYFEFLPENPSSVQAVNALDLADLEIGERYEVVVTTAAGLYRYRLGDIIEVTAFSGQAPVFRFSHRRGVALNLAGEKTSEQHLLQAFAETVGKQPDTGKSIVNFAVGADLVRGRPQYVLFVEVANHRDWHEGELVQFAELFETALQRANPCYASVGRSTGRLNPVSIRALPVGALALACGACTGASSNNGKTPIILAMPVDTQAESSYQRAQTIANRYAIRPRPLSAMLNRNFSLLRG